MLRISSMLVAGLMAAATCVAAVAQTPPSQARPGGMLGEGTRNLIALKDARSFPLYPIAVNNVWGLMDKQGNLVIYPRYDWTDFSYDQFVRAVIHGRTGFLNGNGEWAIPPRLVYADRFHENFAVVGDGKHFGFIDQTGKLRVPMHWDGSLRFKDGMAAVLIKGRVGFIDARGRVVITPRYARARSFSDGLAMVQLPDERGQPGMLGYIDKRGSWVFRDRQHAFEAMGDFCDGLAKAKQGGKWGYIGRAFRFRIKPRFDDARDFTNDVAAVEIDGKWGFIDKSGRVTVQPRFDQADDFDTRLAMVKLNGLFGYVNRTGGVAIEPRYTSAWPFFEGYARVAVASGLAGYIDATGRLVWDPRKATQGFVDLRLKERIALQHRSTQIFNRIVPPPPARNEGPGPPYPPDYLYVEELPKPGMGEAGTQ